MLTSFIMRLLTIRSGDSQPGRLRKDMQVILLDVSREHGGYIGTIHGHLAGPFVLLQSPTSNFGVARRNKHYPTDMSAPCVGYHRHETILHGDTYPSGR